MRVRLHISVLYVSGFAAQNEVFSDRKAPEYAARSYRCGTNPSTFGGSACAGVDCNTDVLRMEADKLNGRQFGG